MKTYGILCCAFYILAKAYVRFWLFKPIHARPAATRYNESLRFIDLAAVAALIAAFFMLINGYDFVRGTILVGGLLAYDGIIRYWFLRVEVRRLCSGSKRLKYRDAARHVRKRARIPMFS